MVPRDVAGTLSTWLGLQDGEGPRASRLFTFIFLLTSAAVLAKSAQRELFLAAYPRSAIPDAFLLSAGVLALASLGVSALKSDALNPSSLVFRTLMAAVR